MGTSVRGTRTERAKAADALISTECPADGCDKFGACIELSPGCLASNKRPEQPVVKLG
jgi:hypothetical protein